MDAAPELRSSRLTLVPLGPRDAGAVHRLWTDPVVRRYLWDDRIIPEHVTRETLVESERGFAGRGLGLWGLYPLDDRRLIGFCGLRDVGFTPDPELLFGLHPDWQRQGLAFAAARRVLEHAFDTLRLPAVAAATDVPNVTSMRLLERLGMELQRRELVHGLDTAFYRLTAERHRAVRHGASEADVPPGASE